MGLAGSVDCDTGGTSGFGITAVFVRRGVGVGLSGSGAE